MKRAIRMGAFGCAIMLVASLLLARTHPFGNAAFFAGAAPAPMMDSSVPPDVRAILEAKCADCHSMRVRLPIYDQFAVRLAPASWMMEDDIVEARERWNLSLWDTYSADEQQSLKGLMASEVKTGDMPPLRYRMIHLNARVSDADVAALSRWAHIMPIVDGGMIGQVGGAGDPDRGATVFEKRCTGCHALDQNREGPRLRGVFGRTSGEIPDYDYSPALKKAGIVWNESSLEQWLTDTDKLVPGNNMDFQVVNPQERRDLISYFKRSSGNSDTTTDLGR